MILKENPNECHHTSINDRQAYKTSDYEKASSNLKRFSTTLAER